MRNWKEVTDWANLEFDFGQVAAARRDARIVGTVGDDERSGTRGDDRFLFGQGGNDTLRGGGGNDKFELENAFNGQDLISGGDGKDRLILSGRYEDTINFDPSLVRSIEQIRFVGGNRYSVVVEDGFNDIQISNSGAAGLDIDASLLYSGSLEYWGSSGKDIVIGSGRADYIVGHGSSDILTGGLGRDKFVYLRDTDSSEKFSPRADYITDFEEGDRIRLPSQYQVTYHIGQTQDRVGDVLQEYDVNQNTTKLSVFIDGDDVADMTIYLSGHFEALRINHGIDVVF